MLQDKFASWLGRLHAELERSQGSARVTSEFARLIGQDGGEVNRWINGKAKPNPRLDTFEQILTRARPGQQIPQIVEEIVAEPAAVRAPSRAALVGDLYLSMLERLFKGNPALAERLLVNIKAAIDQGHLELLNDIAHAVLTKGPHAAQMTVNGLLRDQPSDDSYSRDAQTEIKTARRRVASQYRKIG